MPILKKEIPKLDQKQILRFFMKVLVCESGCWEWSASRRGGYGIFALRRRGFFAHRISYSEFIGDLSPEMDIDHKCKNRSCVNPSHLQQITHSQNILLGDAPSIKRMREKEEKKVCIRGHDLSDSKNLCKWSKRLKCRTCYNLCARSSWKRRKYGPDGGGSF